MLKKCLCKTRVVDPPNTKKCSGCFYIPNQLLLSEDSVAPCGETGTINLLQDADVSICTLSTTGSPLCPILYEIFYYSDGFLTAPTVSNEGILSFTGNGQLGVNEYAKVKLKISCPCKKVGTFINVDIGFKNLCLTTLCPTNQICNPCTGTCIPKNSDLSIKKDSYATSGNSISINL